MNAKYIFGILAVSALVISSCGKKTGGCAKGEKAVVKNFDNDSCDILFKLEDGTYLQPTNLSNFQSLEYNDGDLVWVSYKETSGASLCGMGEIVEMKCIAEREY